AIRFPPRYASRPRRRLSHGPDREPAPSRPPRVAQKLPRTVRRACSQPEATRLHATQPQAEGGPPRKRPAASSRPSSILLEHHVPRGRRNPPPFPFSRGDLRAG